MTGHDVEPERETTATAPCPGRVVAIMNPKAGSAAGEAIRRALGECFREGESSLEVYETRDGEDLGGVVRDRIGRGVDLVIAAGGDGTVSAVADALAGSGTPMGILPMGTANVLARELEIPLDVDEAARLLVGDHRLATIDAMKVGGRHYLTQVGVGLDALMIRDTPTAQKKRFGKLAYLWSAGKHLVGFQPRRFTLEVDGRAIKTRASEVIVANVGTLGQPPFRWGPGHPGRRRHARRLRLEGPDGLPLPRPLLARRSPAGTGPTRTSATTRPAARSRSPRGIPCRSRPTAR